MDPEVVYKNLVIASRRILKNENQFSDETVELAADFLNLDTWLKGGGFLPQKWVTKK